MSGSNRSRDGGRWRLILALSALLVGILAAAGCRRGDAGPASAETLRVSQRNEPAELDPALSSMPDEFFVTRALLEGLVAPSPDGRGVVPAAASRWEVSRDGLRYVFHLRPGGRWSNGDPVTADQFAASYRRALQPSTPAPKAELFYPVLNARAYKQGRVTDFSKVGFRAAGPLTLVVTLERPCPDFLSYAASGPWLPVNPRVVAARGRAWALPGSFVGNGPFVLAEWKPHQRILVRRRADYWDAAGILVDAVALVAMDNGETEERSFRAGQIDVTMAVPPSRLPTYAKESPSRLRTAPLVETRYLAFNTRRGPLADARVRRALSLAVDRDALVRRVLEGGQIASRTLIPPPLPGGEAAPLQTGADLAEARRLLAEAGFPSAHGFPVLELSGWTNLAVLEAVQDMWRRNLGIETTIALRDAKVHVAALREGSFDIGFITSIPDVADPLLILSDYLPGAPGNYAHWSDEGFADDLRRAGAASDPELRRVALAQAEARLDAQCPIAPLYVNTHNYLVSPAVRGWREDGLWNRFYKGVRVDRGPRAP